MRKVYDELVKRIDIDAMMNDGKYITYYSSIEGLFEEVGIEDADEKREYVEDTLNLDFEDLKGDFILLENQNSLGAYLLENVEDAISFMKSESSFKKYVK